MHNCNVSEHLWNMQLNLWKFACINHVIRLASGGLRKVLELHVTCVMFNICNVYTKCLIVFTWVGFGKFGKLGFDCLEKDD